MEGEIRFGLLDNYKSVEGSRQDETEGEASFSWDQKAPQIIFNKTTGEAVGRAESDQNIQYSGTSLNHHYILCTSHPEADIDVLKRKFGPFVVRIADPLVLLERITSIWESNDWALREAFVVPVVYNKGGMLEPNPYLIGPRHYSYAQKLPSFEEECEFRYVLTCTVDTNRKLPDHLITNVGDCRDICTLI